MAVGLQLGRCRRVGQLVGGQRSLAPLAFGPGLLLALLQLLGLGCELFGQRGYFALQLGFLLLQLHQRAGRALRVGAFAQLLAVALLHLGAVVGQLLGQGGGRGQQRGQVGAGEGREGIECRLVEQRATEATAAHAVHHFGVGAEVLAVAGQQAGNVVAVALLSLLRLRAGASRGQRGRSGRGGRSGHGGRGGRAIFFNEEAFGGFGEVFENGHGSRWLVTATQCQDQCRFENYFSDY